MKMIWKVSLGAIALGLALALAGFALGADLNGLYWDNATVRLADDVETRVTERNLARFESIDVDVDFCAVELIPSDQYGLEILGHGGQWNWSVDGETLKVRHRAQSTSQLYFAVSPRQNYVKIYLPAAAALNDVSVKLDSGDVDIARINAKSARIDVDFGDVALREATVGDLDIELDSGDFSGKGLAVERMQYKDTFGNGHFEESAISSFTAGIDSGDLELRDFAAGQADVRIRFGKITASRLSLSKATIDVDSGSVELSGDLSGATTITSRFADIAVETLKSKAAYAYDIAVKFGEITVDGEVYERGTAVSEGASGHTLKIDADSGDVDVTFGGGKAATT